MKRSLSADEHRVWTLVTATIRPAAGRDAPSPRVSDPAPTPVQPAPAASPPRVSPTPTKAAAKITSLTLSYTPHGIEPGRRRRIVRGREDIAARLDLHGMTQDQARRALADFLRRAQADGYRAALVITGKGVGGDGVLRRRVPEWLADPGLRGLIAGASSADRRHGGEGALYVALKRPAG